MNTELLKSRVKGRVVFRYFVADQLVYACDDGFCFPVPIEDTRNGDASPPIFNASDKAIYFMRWIRKHMENLHFADAAGF